MKEDTHGGEKAPSEGGGSYQVLGARWRGRRLGAHATPLEQVAVHPALDLQPPTTFAGSVTAIHPLPCFDIIFFVFGYCGGVQSSFVSVSRESGYVFFFEDE